MRTRTRLLRRCPTRANAPNQLSILLNRLNTVCLSRPQPKRDCHKRRRNVRDLIGALQLQNCTRNRHPAAGVQQRQHTHVDRTTLYKDRPFPRSTLGPAPIWTRASICGADLAGLAADGHWASFCYYRQNQRGQKKKGANHVPVPMALGQISGTVAVRMPRIAFENGPPF